MKLLCSANTFIKLDILLEGPLYEEVVPRVIFASFLKKSSIYLCFIIKLPNVGVFSYEGQIFKADFTCPPWFSSSAKKLIKRILDPSPITVCVTC